MRVIQAKAHTMKQQAVNNSLVVIALKLNIQKNSSSRSRYHFSYRRM